MRVRHRHKFEDIVPAASREKVAAAVACESVVVGTRNKPIKTRSAGEYIAAIQAVDEVCSTRDVEVRVRLGAADDDCHRDIQCETISSGVHDNRICRAAGDSRTPDLQYPCCRIDGEKFIV